MIRYMLIELDLYFLCVRGICVSHQIIDYVLFSLVRDSMDDVSFRYMMTLPTCSLINCVNCTLFLLHYIPTAGIESLCVIMQGVPKTETQLFPHMQHHLPVRKSRMNTS